MSDERGAVAVTVALLLVPLLGMAALVIDVGAMYQERRELQNGADAAALAIAENCARGLPSCASGLLNGTASTYANANSNDSTSNVDSTTLDLANRTIAVAVSTRTTSGTTAIPFNFAQVLGFSGKHVTANATATWGYPRSLTVLPMTFDACELETATVASTVWNRTGLLALHTGGNGNAGSCTADPAYKDYPGGFGWLDTGSGGCQPTITLDPNTGTATASGKTGASTPSSCDASTFQSLAADKTIAIPIYDKVTDVQNPGKGNGKTSQYEIIGFGAFHVQQYDMGSGGPTWRYPSGTNGICNRLATDAFTPPSSDNPIQACLRGYFTTFLTPSAALSGSGVDFGVISVSLKS